MRYMRWLAACGATTALAALGLFVVPHALASVSSLSIAASADAYAAEAAPATAEGTADPANCFVNDDSGARKTCHLSFTVTGLGAGDTVTAAEVRIVDKGDARGTKLVNLSTSTGSWSESTVTWNTRPATGAVVAAQSSHAFGADSVFTLAPATVAGNGTYTFVMWSPAGSYSTGMNFYTKENTVGEAPPRLVLTVSHQSAPVAALSADTLAGPVPLTVHFDASRSTDPDGGIASYRFDFGDGTAGQSGVSPLATHTFTTIGTFQATVTVTDSAGLASTARVTVTVAPRFPGDPGPGRLRMGVNDVAKFEGVEAAMPAPGLGLHRLYTRAVWTLPMGDMQTAIDKGQIPVVSWGFSPYGSPGAVPQSAVDTMCANLKSFAPHPVWAIATGLHEPENESTGPQWAADYRALGREVVATCDAMGVTNVAWLGPAYMNCTFSGGCPGRDWRIWYADWKGSDTGTSADFYTGAQKVLDIDTMDIYVPLVGTTNWVSPANQLNNMTNAMTADGAPIGPRAVLELGVKTDLADLTRGPSMMQNGYDGMLARNGVGIIWWTSGGDSFCSGPVPESDSGCQRQNKLADLVRDPRTAHP